VSGGTCSAIVRQPAVPPHPSHFTRFRVVPQAAKTAGVQTVGVLSKGKADQAAAAHADVVVSSLLDLQLERCAHR
jgi:hypothetical protein